MLDIDIDTCIINNWQKSLIEQQWMWLQVAVGSGLSLVYVK